uniref:Uncharacterized protein n=1 Tax=Lepeophtheirus salmonis TaxID=72036 RepID=A0A0K2TII9_LEPSM
MESCWLCRFTFTRIRHHRGTSKSASSCWASSSASLTTNNNFSRW